jgi:hypothetical protein
MEAQSAGDKKQAINALQRVLEKYNYNAPAGIHLPALLRLVLPLVHALRSIDDNSSTARLLQSELVKDGAIQTHIMDQLCKIFEGGG